MDAALQSGNGVPAIESRAAGTFRLRMLRELFRSSGVFPLANILFELLLDGRQVLAGPDLYAMVAAALLQSFLLTRWESGPAPRRVLGNLVAPALYTALEAPGEWATFFAAPNHWAWWLSALAIGASQSYRLHGGRRIGYFLIVLEDVVRASILVVLYASFEVQTGAVESFSGFLSERDHEFVVVGSLFLGIVAGLASVSEARSAGLLRESAALLRRYSEWLLGRELLERSLHDPSVLELRRRERGVLFMDVRSFTAWSETVPPEVIARLINDYYLAAERALADYAPLKLKFSADEVLAVFAKGEAAASAALSLRAAVEPVLAHHGLAAGIGVHVGPVVEGLYGAQEIKAYDVLGDAVNTAKRVETAAAGGEVLFTEQAVALLPRPQRQGTWRHVTVKGKRLPIRVLAAA